MTPAALEAALADPRRKYGPPEHMHRVWRGMTRERLYREAFAPLARDGVVRVAEIGVADGRNALAICGNVPGVRFLGVDPWRAYQGNPRGGPQSQHDGNYELAKARLGAFDVTLQPGFSGDVVRSVADGSLDAVYIDGNHSFDWVMLDLIEWSRRVRSGGIVAGHDFYHFKWAGVVEAVVAYTEAHGIAWSLTDEKEPSFWWVKP